MTGIEAKEGDCNWYLRKVRPSITGITRSERMSEGGSPDNPNTMPSLLKNGQLLRQEGAGRVLFTYAPSDLLLILHGFIGQGDA